VLIGVVSRRRRSSCEGGEESQELPDSAVLDWGS
jgi:hypothetical protein